MATVRGYSLILTFLFYLLCAFCHLSGLLFFQDVLNHLGSCELDEDDLMLDLEFLEEQNLQPPGKS